MIAQRSADLVYSLSKRAPPRAPNDEIRKLIAVGFRTDVESEKRVRDGLIKGHVQGLERLQRRDINMWDSIRKTNPRGTKEEKRPEP